MAARKYLSEDHGLLHDSAVGRTFVLSARDHPGTSASDEALHVHTTPSPTAFHKHTRRVGNMCTEAGRLCAYRLTIQGDFFVVAQQHGNVAGGVVSEAVQALHELQHLLPGNVDAVEGGGEQGRFTTTSKVTRPA